MSINCSFVGEHLVLTSALPSVVCLRGMKRGAGSTFCKGWDGSFLGLSVSEVCTEEDICTVVDST